MRGLGVCMQTLPDGTPELVETPKAPSPEAESLHNEP